jgi:hypothetical protein
MQWQTVLHVTGRRQLGSEAAGASGLGEGVRRHLSEGVQPGGPGSVGLAVAGKVPCLILESDCLGSVAAEQEADFDERRQ